jgi:hypothetical protein
MWARAFDTIPINDVTLKKPSLRHWTTTTSSGPWRDERKAMSYNEA